MSSSTTSNQTNSGMHPGGLFGCCDRPLSTVGMHHSCRSNVKCCHQCSF